MQRFTVVVRTIHATYIHEGYGVREDGSAPAVHRPPAAQPLPSDWRIWVESVFVALPGLEQLVLEVWGCSAAKWTRTESGLRETMKTPDPWDVTYVRREVWSDMRDVQVRTNDRGLGQEATIG